MTSLGPNQNNRKPNNEAILYTGKQQKKQEYIDHMNKSSIPDAESGALRSNPSIFWGMRHVSLLLLLLACRPDVLFRWANNALMWTIQAQIIDLLEVPPNEYHLQQSLHTIPKGSMLLDKAMVMYAGWNRSMVQLKKSTIHVTHTIWSLLSSSATVGLSIKENCGPPGTPPSLHTEFEGRCF